MIRRANEKDLKSIHNLLSQVLEVHAKGRPDIFISGTRKYTDNELLQLFKDDSKPVFVWTDENDIARAHAFCVFEETKNCNNMHDMKTLYIDDICVDEEFRHRHIASEMFEYLKNFAKKNNCYHITLNVWELNKEAKAFYEKMGMKVLKTTLETII